MTFPQSVPLVRANTSYYPQVLTHEISYTESDAGGIGESSVDVDPMNSSIFAVAALNFYGPFRTEGFPAFYSMDSGATWTEVGPSGPPLFGNSYPGFNDPQVSFDANGNVFLGWGVFVPPQDLSVVQYYLLKSVDQGKTYSYLTNPPLANNVTYLFPDGSYKTPCSARTTFPVIDYPKLAIDKSSVSHYEGNIYVNGAIWFNATGTGCMAYPAFARSTDGGNTWSNRTVISDFSGYAEGADNIAIAPDGTIYRMAAGSCSDSEGLALEKSIDGGQTFSDLCVYDSPGVLNARDHATVVVSPTDPARMWVSFQAIPVGQTADHIYVMSSSDVGASWSVPSRVDNILQNDNVEHEMPSMSISSTGRLDVEWRDFRLSTNSSTADVFYSWSLDGGNTWGNGTEIRLTSTTGTYCFTPACNSNDFMSIISMADRTFAFYSTSPDNNELDGEVSTISFGDFNASASTDMLDVPWNSSASLEIMVQSLNNFTGTVKVSVSNDGWVGNNRDLYGYPQPTSILIASGGNGTVIFYVRSYSWSTPGTYKFTIDLSNEGPWGSIDHTIAITAVLNCC